MAAGRAQSPAARHKILNSVASGVLCLLLLLTGLFFAVIIGSLVASEVMPAVAQGSLDVETNTMILNRVWRGNEIYVLLAAYGLVGTMCLYGSLRIGTRTVHGLRRKPE